MKAERRHELKQNSLVKNLESAPAFFQKYGSRILLGVILCLLAFILVRNYSTAKADKALNANKDLGLARYQLATLREVDMSSPEHMAQTRRDAVKAIDGAVRDTLTDTEDPKLRAEAMLVRGEMNWALANLPPIPGSTTRPELANDKTGDEYLKASEDAYNEILAAPLNQNTEAVTTARLSLAAIAENREQWDKAREMYQKVMDDTNTPQAFKDLARQRQDGLKTLSKPVLVGGPAPLPDFLKPKVTPPPPPTTLPAGPIGPMLPPLPPSTQPALGAPNPSPSTPSAPAAHRPSFDLSPAGESPATSQPSSAPALPGFAPSLK